MLQVTVEDCFVALDETAWDMYQAIKFIKLKQLLALRLGGVQHCKSALMRSDWNVEEAADILLLQTGRTSPDCIDV